MREVEVKFRIRDPAPLIAALKARGIELGLPVEQDDQAYAPEGWSYGDDRRGVPFARLRTVDGRHLFTVKRPAENVLSCEEHETAIADRAQMHRAIVAMGFMPAVRIRKVRRSATFGELTVCLDEVDGVGVFVKVERQVPDACRGRLCRPSCRASSSRSGSGLSGAWTPTTRSCGHPSPTKTPGNPGMPPITWRHGRRRRPTAWDPECTAAGSSAVAEPVSVP